MRTYQDNWYNWTFRRAMGSLFSSKSNRDDLDVQLEDIVPPVMVMLGRMIFEIQHFVKMHEDSEFSIDGWPAHHAPRARLVTGVTNIFVMGCIVAYLFPSTWAHQLHQHSLWSHLIGQILLTPAWDKTAEIFEQHFVKYASMAKLNPNTILETMAHHIDVVQPKYDRLRGDPASKRHAKLRSWLHARQRAWRFPMFPLGFTKLANGDWWDQFKLAITPTMQQEGLEWRSSEEHGIMYLTVTDDPQIDDHITRHAAALLHGASDCDDTDTENSSFMLRMLCEYSELAQYGPESAQGLLSKLPPRSKDRSADYDHASRCTADLAAKIALTRLNGAAEDSWPGGTTKKKEPVFNVKNLRAAAFKLEQQVMSESLRQPGSSEVCSVLAASQHVTAEVQRLTSKPALKGALKQWYQAWYAARQSALAKGDSSAYWAVSDVHWAHEDDGGDDSDDGEDQLV